MGGCGRPYAACTPELCREMKRLVRYADVLPPNLTEARILPDRPYRTKFSCAELEDMAGRLCEQRPENG